MRLTKDIRNAIVEAVLNHRFGPDEDALRQKEIDLGYDIYNEVYDSVVQARMAALPEGALPTEEQLRVVYGDDFYRAELGGRWPVFWVHSFGWNHAPKLSPVLANRVKEIKAEKEQLADARRAARIQIEGVVNSVNTAKRLREVWPEVESFIPCEDRATGNALQIVPAELNVLLGLPPENAK